MFTGTRVVAGSVCEIEVHQIARTCGASYVINVHPLSGPLEHLRRRFFLTRTQLKVALLLSERHSDREIAKELGISLHTARNHVRAVRMKLHVRSRREVPGIVRSSVFRAATAVDESAGNRRVGPRLGAAAWKTDERAK
jgi:DNA-binding CsgD family transcriptional regulator